MQRCPLCSELLNPIRDQLHPRTRPAPGQRLRLEERFWEESYHWTLFFTRCLGCKEEIIWAKSTYDRAVVLVKPTHPTPPVSEEVPENHKNEYLEAHRVLGMSPKAAAALARRLLEAILTEQGYGQRSLNQKIEAFRREGAPHRKLDYLIDGVRSIGNDAAHPFTHGGEIRDVGPREADAVLAIIEEVFNHFWVDPAALEKTGELLGLTPS